MKHIKRYEELINRYNVLVDKYNSTKSLALKGYYAGEMAALEEELCKLAQRS